MRENYSTTVSTHLSSDSVIAYSQSLTGQPICCKFHWTHSYIIYWYIDAYDLIYIHRVNEIEYMIFSQTYYFR